MNQDTKDRIRTLLSEIKTLLDTGDSAPDHDEQEPDKLNQFLDANVFSSPGEKILFKEFRERFADSIPREKRNFWTPRRIRIVVETRFVVRAGTANKNYIFDASFTRPGEIPRDRFKYVGDSSAGVYFWKHDDSGWKSVSNVELSKMLATFGATPAQIAAVYDECLANPVSLNDLLNNESTPNLPH